MTSHRSIARHLVPERHAAALRELGIFGVAYLVYFGVRAVTEGTAATAMHNAINLIRLEQRLGIAWEGAIQEGIVGSRLLVDAATAVHIYGHWPVIVLTGALLPPTERVSAERAHRARHLRSLARGRPAHGPAPRRHGDAQRGGLPAGAPRRTS
ncbi:MAG: hypothetical protein ACXW08_12180, partial [Solirubrobacteraceae bacterium]